MTLLPLNMKKKLSRFMHWFGQGTAAVLTIGVMVGAFGYSLFNEYGSGPDRRQQKKELQVKVDHLLGTYKTWRTLDDLVVMVDKGQDVDLDLTRARKSDEKLKAAFDAEAQQTGIALAHATDISNSDRYDLYKPLNDLKPHPDFLKMADEGSVGFESFNRVRARVMDRPGFTPTVKTAQEIVASAQHSPGMGMAEMFGPAAAGVLLAVGWAAMRKRLDGSISAEEEALRRAAEAMQAAEAARQKEEADRAAAAAAAEKAEAERLAKLPPSVELGRDINVKQLKLSKPEGGPA